MSDKEYSKNYNPAVETVEEFLQRFKLQNADKLVKNEKEPQNLAMHLSNCLPTTILTDLQRKLKPKLITEVTYEELEATLVSSYGVKKSVVGAAVSLFSRKQKRGESLENYAQALNELSTHCGYGECCRGKLVRDCFLSGLFSPRLMATLVTDCKAESTFADCVQRAKTLEQAVIDIQDLNPAANVQDTFQVRGNTRTPSKTVPTDYKCVRCGLTGRHRVEDCFARTLTCHGCGTTGHIQRACLKKNSTATGTRTTPTTSPTSSSTATPTSRPTLVPARKSTSTNIVTPPEEQDPAEFFTVHNVDKNSSHSYGTSENSQTYEGIFLDLGFEI